MSNFQMFCYHPRHPVCCRRLLGRRYREQPKPGIATALAGRRPEPLCKCTTGHYLRSISSDSSSSVIFATPEASNASIPPSSLIRFKKPNVIFKFSAMYVITFLRSQACTPRARRQGLAVEVGVHGFSPVKGTFLGGCNNSFFRDSNRRIWAFYNASKAAVTRLSKYLAVEYR